MKRRTLAEAVLTAIASLDKPRVVIAVVFVAIAALVIIPGVTS